MSDEDDFNFDIGNDLPLAQRLKNKGMSFSQKKTLSSAFSDNEDDDDSTVTPPSKQPRRNVQVELTPPPECSPYVPSTSSSAAAAWARSSSRYSAVLNDDDDDLPDTEELIPPPQSLTSALSKSSSSSSSKSARSLSKEEKETEKKRKEEQKLIMKKLKETEKVMSKEMKEAEKLVSKQSEKGEVNKYLTVVIDQEAVNAPPGNEILAMLQNPPSGKEDHVFKYKVESLPIPGALLWRRKVISYNTENGKVNIEETLQEEQRALVLISTQSIVDKISDNSIEMWAVNVKEALGDKHITLMIYGYNEYFNAEKNARERVKTASVRGEEPSRRDVNRLNATVSKYDFEEALVSLSLNQIVDHLAFSKTSGKGWKDLAGSVFHQTRGVAEAPFKLKKGLSGAAGFGFWARADGKDCVDSKNLSEYWKQILMQVSSGAGLEKVASIVSQYPSPQSLMSAYGRCSSVKEAESLLANVEMRRTDNVLGGTRKVGPDISRKIYLMISSNNPEQSISSKG